ncbi:MAG TPA: phosphate ABC transporter permease subunit PstC [Blastocatellia bacterium]|nr:phosphate ABC transporter permease subunit PstC [Blastocatellia bacterium]
MSATSSTATPRWAFLGRFRPANLPDTLFQGVTGLCACVVLLLIGAMFVEMIQNSVLSIQKFGFRFLSESTWDPVAGEFGALPFVYGTLVTSIIALLISVPISIAVATFVTYQAPARLRRPVISLVELLAAIPSVAYGLWGIFVLAPFMRDYVAPVLRDSLGFIPLFQGPSFGVGMLTAGLILAIMVTPIVTAVSRDVLAAVPTHQRDGALALGGTQWESTRVVLSYALPGIVGAVILGLARAVGETMAVTMVIGNRPEISASLFAPGYTMASVIANEFTEATEPLYLHALIEIGVLLFVVSFLVRACAQLLVWYATRGRTLGREG